MAKQSKYKVEKSGCDTIRYFKKAVEIAEHYADDDLIRVMVWDRLAIFLGRCSEFAEAIKEHPKAFVDR